MQHRVESGDPSAAHSVQGVPVSGLFYFVTGTDFGRPAVHHYRHVDNGYLDVSVTLRYSCSALGGSGLAILTDRNHKLGQPHNLPDPQRHQACRTA